MNEHENTSAFLDNYPSICDRYTRPILKKHVLTNITELLKTDEKSRLMSLFLNVEKYNIHALSDFEYFAALCALVPKCKGTREGELLEEELLAIFESSLDFSNLPSESYVRELWDRGNEALRECHGRYAEILSKKSVKKLYKRECLVSNLDLVEKYNEEKETLSLVADFRGLSFVRPDPYHASLAEKKLSAGETLSAEEEALLAAEALYLAVTTERERTLEIRLLADGDGSTARELIDYLVHLGARGQVLVAADGAMTNDTLLSLIACSKNGLSVRLEIVLGENDSRACAYARLLELSARYPISLWRFGGVLWDSPLFFAGHRHMARVVARVLEEVIPNKDERTRLLAQIF